jgi:hypothetical protein
VTFHNQQVLLRDLPLSSITTKINGLNVTGNERQQTKVRITVSRTDNNLSE